MLAVLFEGKDAFQQNVVSINKSSLLSQFVQVANDIWYLYVRRVIIKIHMYMYMYMYMCIHWLFVQIGGIANI